MIVYVDSSVLVRSYLADEDGHEEAVALLVDPDIAAVTGTWTHIEVSGALVRAARAGRIDERPLLSLLDSDLASDGPVTVVSMPQERVEDVALEIVRIHGLRAMDAWHLSVAHLALPALAEPGEDPFFATRDAAQADVAHTMGLRVL